MGAPKIDRSLKRLLEQKKLFLVEAEEPDFLGGQRVDVCKDDGHPGGLPIGAVIKTSPSMGLWLALARTRSYGSMDEVAKALPSIEAAIYAVIAHARY